MARRPDTRKQPHPSMSGSQIHPLDWRGREPLDEGRYEAYCGHQRPEEQHYRTAPVTPLRLVAPPPHRLRRGMRALVAGGIDDQQDRHITTEAEEESTHPVSDVDTSQSA